MPATFSKLILKHFNQNISDILSPTDGLVSTICKLIHGLKSGAVSIRTKKRKRKATFPCGVCRKNVNINHRAIQCDQCNNNWIHIKCNGITSKEYESLKKEDQNIPWLCLICTVLQMAEIFPFGLIANDLCSVNNIPNLDIRSKLTDIPNLKDFDLEENLIHSIQSDYHPLHSLNSFLKEHNITKSLALYHVNINSLDKHIDEIRTVLAYPNINWDIIAISETGEQPHGFKRNIRS